VALATGAPVIPVAMIDTEKIQPPGKVMPKLMRPGIRIGKPLDFSRYNGMEHDRFVLRAVTDEVMYEIMKLSGQEYVDIYATAAKRQIADAAKAEKQAQKEDKAAKARSHETDEEQTGPTPRRGPVGGWGSGGHGQARRVMRMSVEQPLWRALTGYRVLTMLYAIGLFATALRRLRPPGKWPSATTSCCSSGPSPPCPGWQNAASCTKRFLAVDLTIALTGILLTPLADDTTGSWRRPDPAVDMDRGFRAGVRHQGRLALGGLRLHARRRRQPDPARRLGQDTVHNVLLVWVASIAIGYVVEVARASERTLARALEIEAATRERERLARDIHDGVLQVLAMVQRRGAVLGGDAADLGRLAGEQEVALRTLVSAGSYRCHGVSRTRPRALVARWTSRTRTTAAPATCAPCSPRTPPRR
jgi:hypothetical protein